MTKLSTILNNIKNSKYKKGYIKYLKSLDYDEFRTLFVYYMAIIIRYENIYIKKNIKKYTLFWLKNYFIRKKYIRLYSIFYNSNQDFVIKINKKIEYDNNIRQHLINNIKEVTETISNLEGKIAVITEKSTRKDLIDFTVLLIDSIYLRNELNKLLDKLDKYKKI